MPRNKHYYQERYWRELVQLKVQLQYLGNYQHKTQQIDSGLKMFSAVASSTSIAAWAVWQQAEILWAGVIAATHLLSAVKEFLPYQKRIKQTAALGAEVAEIFVFAEHKWFLVAEGRLTNSEIHELTMDIKRRLSKAAIKHLGDSTLPANSALRAKTRQQVEAYFRIHY